MDHFKLAFIFFFRLLFIFCAIYLKCDKSKLMLSVEKNYSSLWFQFKLIWIRFVLVCNNSIDKNVHLNGNKKEHLRKKRNHSKIRPTICLNLCSTSVVCFSFINLSKMSIYFFQRCRRRRRFGIQWIGMTLFVLNFIKIEFKVKWMIL